MTTENREARLSALNLKVSQLLDQAKISSQNDNKQQSSANILQQYLTQKIHGAKDETDHFGSMDQLISAKHIDNIRNSQNASQTRSKTPATGSRASRRRYISELIGDGNVGRQNATEREGAQSALNIREVRNKSNGYLSVNDYVRQSFKDYKNCQSELNYHPTGAQLRKSVIMWKQQPKKTSFLDPVIKAEKIKLAPTAYSTHSNWGKELGNGYKQGHVKKGVFRPRERPLLTKEYMDEAKKKGIPAPGAYKLPQNKKFPLGHSSKSEKNSIHTDAAKWQAMQTPTVCYKDPA